jgi:tRNA pseudouridine13 synthase
MYVHAYQSYIWNLVTSERIKQSATQPLVGDLVYEDVKAEDFEEAEGGWTSSAILCVVANHWDRGQCEWQAKLANDIDA